ncbi:MAG: DUF4091 domain-containing protein [Lentisphaerae bacterium]|nr:DUF4091 domain-containing protein [Lentisphaerota bacterium]
MKKLIVACAALLVAASAVEAREIYPAGDFEGKSFKPLHCRRYANINSKRQYKIPKGLVTERIQNEKAFAGKQSLLVEAGKDGCHEINLYSIPVVKGKKYEFSFRYFIAQGGPDLRVSGRVSFFLPGPKYRHLFPNGSVEQGKWQQLKVTYYPPAEAVYFSTTIWLGKGPYKIYLDDVKVTELEEKKSVTSDKNAKLLSSTGGVTVWQQTNYRRVDANSVPAGLVQGKTVELTAAANEQEPFQLAVFPKTPLKQLSLAISDLKGKAGVIPSKVQSYGIVRYITMKNPDNPTLKGEIADPVVPDKVTDAPADKNTVFFVRINAPKGTKPGVYTGSVQLLSGTKTVATVPVRLTVRNFELPDTATIRTFFYGNIAATKKGYADPRSSKEISEDISQIFKDHRITGNTCVYPKAPKYTIKDGKLTVTDWSEFDKEIMRLYNDYGMRSFTLAVLGMKGDNFGWFAKSGVPKMFGHSMFSQTGRDLAGDYARQFHEHWIKTFPKDAQYYSYIYDEPPPKVYKELNKFLAGVRAKAPAFRFFTPHKVDPELPHFTVFCVPFGFGYVDLEREKGKEIWYYNWPQPLDHHNYIKNRLFAWQIYANGGKGGLKWQTTATPGPHVNPWNALEKTHADGGATTIFPAVKPGGKLVPSLRLAQIRESMDDGDYLNLLERKVEKYFPGEGRNYVYSQIRDLMPELPFGFTNDSALLYQVRDRIGAAIENFDKGFPLLVKSMPLNFSSTELTDAVLTLKAPNGTIVEVNGKKAGVIAKGKLVVNYPLNKLGLNTVDIKVSYKGSVKTAQLFFTLKQDANLKKLEALSAEMAKYKVDNRTVKNFLAAAAKGTYTAADRGKCAKLVDEASRKIFQARLKAVKKSGNVLVNAMNEQAKWMFDNGLYERTGYYLNLADGFAKCNLPAKSRLKIVPVNLHGNFGFRISNGLVEFTLLELGGRIVSFKVGGVEMFDAGALDKTLPLKVRAGKLYHTFTHTTIPGLGGYEDAGKEVLPECAVDWDLAIKEVSGKRIALECSMLMRGGKFRISRIMSIVPGKPEVKIDYTIANVFPAEFKSDDPSHYQFHWRGRLRPRIAADRQLDTLVVPTSKKLKATVFDMNKPLFYEERSVLLDKPELGAFNPVKKVGFTWQLDPSIRYAYLWYNSKGDHNGKNKVYTLEVFRSNYGNKPGIKGNTPFFIEPGKSVNFTVTFKGYKM